MSKDNPQKDDLSRVIEATEKTGFLFEQQVADQLRDDGWTVIPNRYYLDDISGVPREIDILAYKVGKTNDIMSYTALLISCKKALKNDWVLLTRPIDRSAVNLDYFPLTCWTNSGICKVTKLEERLKNAVEGKSVRDSFCNRIFGYQRSAFAFQEVDATRPEPKNDKAIYQSVETLLKAANYEIESLRHRKRSATFYTFHLVSVVDGNMYEVRPGEQGPEAFPTEVGVYTNRFILGQQDKFHRIHFCTGTGFGEILTGLNEFAVWQLAQLEERIGEFRKNLLSNWEYLNVFRDQMKKELVHRINYQVRRLLARPDFHEDDLWIEASEDKDLLRIEIPEADEEVIQAINSDEYLINVAKHALQKYYKYDGPFEFAELGTPF